MYAMSWAQTLRTFLASPSRLRHRNGASVFECMCRAHLQGPPGHTIHAHSLPLLRQLRWELLKSGTPEQKAKTLEAILLSYANACHLYTYDPVRSERENHSIILEQLQCIVEARLSDVPVRATHYRFLLQSPQLSQLSSNMPLLLFKEMLNTGGTLTDNARVDVGVGLASAGHWEEALRVCPRTRLAVLIGRVAALRRHGWRQACILASHFERQEEGEMAIQDETRLECLAAALALRHAAMPDSSIGIRMEKLIEAYSRQREGTLPPKRVIEYFVSSCSPEQWRVAVDLVMRHNNNSGSGASSGTATTRIPLGKVMLMLNETGQWKQVLHLYQSMPSVSATNERQHAAVHNHAVVALALGNLWQQAIQFYTSQPVKNVYTHITWLRLVLLERKIPFEPTWQSCIEAYNSIETPDHRYSENLAHQLVTVGQWMAALTVAKMASKRIPRVLLTAISAAVLASNEPVLWKATKELGASRRGVSAKQLCTAAAVVSCCRKDVPRDVLETMANALNSCMTSQEQFDDAVYHLGRCMALLHGAAGIEAMSSVPPAIALLMRSGSWERTDESWVFALALLQKMSAKGWALTAAAPSMLSLGLSASIAIHFLPD